MTQSQKNKEDKQKTTGLEGIAARFEKAKQPAIRRVKLIYSSCCGCGCYDQEIERSVPFDSSLQDGDRVEGFEKDDKVL